MGLMAVFVLILVILLWDQNRLTTDLAQSKERAEQALEDAMKQRQLTEEALESVTLERAALESERGTFAIELMELFETTYDLVLAQDNAENWLTAVFEEGDCRLRMTERGELVIATPDGGRAAASLYESGQFVLSVEGRQALLTCRDNFLKLAHCLTPEDNVPEAVSERRKRLCPGVGVHSLDMAVPVLRAGIEALVLEGNTDQIPLGGGTPSIRAGGYGVTYPTPVALSFVENAYLGAERARQALGNLIALVADANEDQWDALEVMMSRVRIESPSFGRFQAGPQEWREAGCEGPGSCAAARNLALRVRWQKRALRRPFELVRERICGLLVTPDSSFAKGLLSQGHTLLAERERFGCPETVP
jgi:hypothetical protein